MTLKEIQLQVLELDPRIIVKPVLANDFWIGPSIDLPAQLEAQVRQLPQKEQKRLSDWLYDNYYQSLQDNKGDVQKAIRELLAELSASNFLVPVKWEMDGYMEVRAPSAEEAIERARYMFMAENRPHDRLALLDSFTQKMNFAEGNDPAQVHLNDRADFDE